MNINIIAAISDNGVIGKNGKLPWHIPEDMKRFKELTTGHTIVMGRKTFESLPCLLESRINCLLSTTIKQKLINTGNEKTNAYDVNVFDSVSGFLASVTKKEIVWVIGGSNIYREFMPHAQRMYITRVHQTIEGGTAFFPEIDLNTWHLEHIEKHKGFDFEIYAK